jgi:hypothetical protein
MARFPELTRDQMTDAQKRAYDGIVSGPRGARSRRAGVTPSTDYVYVMQFEGDKIVHMTKIWHVGLAMKELGWS